MAGQDRTLKRIARFQVLLLSGMLTAGGIASLVLPKPTVSEAERRELAAMPVFSWESLFHGDYIQDLEAFYADTFPLRDRFVSLAALEETARGLRYDGIRYHEAPGQGSSGAAPITGTVTPPSAETPEEETSQPQTPSDEPSGQENPGASSQETEETGEQRGSCFVYRDMALPIFYSNPAGCQRYAQVINNYKAVLGDDVTVYNLVIPSAIEFYLPERYKSVTSDEKENIDYIYSLLDPGVVSVDAYTPMDAAKEDYIYFRTDHHWTARGAYAAYTAFAGEAGFTPVPLEDMRYGRLDDFLGTLYYQTQDEALARNPDYVEYFVPPTEAVAYQYLPGSPYYGREIPVFAEYASGQYSYSVFLHGDYPLTHIHTANGNGRKILMVKESFGNAFAPFLISHYEDIYVVDQRYFELGLVDFIRQNEIGELLFINNIFAANTDIRINEIQNLMYQTPAYTAPAQEDDAGRESGDGAENQTEEESGENASPEEESGSSGTQPEPDVRPEPDTRPPFRRPSQEEEEESGGFRRQSEDEDPSFFEDEG